MPKLIPVHCYLRAEVSGGRAHVQINPDYIVSIQQSRHEHEGKEIYSAILTMATGGDYYITQEDYQRILEAVEP